MEEAISNESFNWHRALEDTYQDFSQQIVDYAPQLIGALVLLILGWILARLLRSASRKVVQGFDNLFRKASRQDGPNQEKMKHSYALILGQMVFWAVLLFFIAASANLLGWKMFTGWMDSVVSFLPRLITGLLIILAGYLISNAVRAAILGTAGSQSALLARITQITILFCAIVIGIEQAGLDMNFLTTVFVVILGILLAGAALAFGLGARSLVANIVGIQYARKHYRLGEHLQLTDVEGDILEFTASSIVLETDQGRAVVPGKRFHEEVSILGSGLGNIASPNQKKGEEHGS